MFGGILLKKLLIALLCVTQVVILGGSQRKNAEMLLDTSREQAIDLNKDGKNEKILVDDNNVSIFSSDGEKLFEKKGDGNNTSMAAVKDSKAGDTKLIVESRTRDTSAELSYSILKYDGSSVKEIASRKSIYKGKVTAHEDGSIVEEKPVYAEKDCNAVPSKVEKTVYKLEADKLLSCSTETVPYYYSSTYASTGYTNPSADYISKLLEKAANEYGIPSAILKGIAFQESSWRQFDSTGAPLVSYDGYGVGIMQVSYTSDNNPDSTSDAHKEYVNRLSYDIEFNISEGARILMVKWALQTAGAQWKIPKVGDGSPLYLEHWYYAIWAYNGYSEKNNPALYYDTAYQTKVIKHIHERYLTPMIDLYANYPTLFPSSGVPRTDIAEIAGMQKSDVKTKAAAHEYLVIADGTTIRDANMNDTNTDYYSGDVVEIKGDPKVYNCYLRYYVEGEGKAGWVAGNYIKSIGDLNNDNLVDLYDITKVSEAMDGGSTKISSDNVVQLAALDVNSDSVIDIKDISLLAKNYNFTMFQENIN